MDIGSGKSYPANALSNFAPHPFVLDSVGCASMEGFLQSLKFKNPEMQKEVCKLVGYVAKRKGKYKNWRRFLYWQGKQYDRFKDEYQELLDRAFTALAKNTKFHKALLASKDSILTHNIGKRKKTDTVLTTSEFCGRLTIIRKELQDKEKNKL